VVNGPTTINQSVAEEEEKLTEWAMEEWLSVWLSWGGEALRKEANEGRKGSCP